MGKINVGRVILGGFVAGIIINIAEAVTNGMLLNRQWKDWAAKVGPVTHQPTGGQAMTLWILLAFALGMVAVWLYAAVRPRFGPGPKTAILIGFVLWIIYWPLVAVEHIALGTIPMNMLVLGDLGGLVGILLATLAGAAIYKE